MRPLPHPPDAEQDEDSLEMIRSWVVDGELQVSLGVETAMGSLHDIRHLGRTAFMKCRMSGCDPIGISRSVLGRKQKATLWSTYGSYEAEVELFSGANGGGRRRFGDSGAWPPSPSLTSPFGSGNWPALTMNHEWTRIHTNDRRTLPPILHCGARNVSALHSAFRSFVSIRVHSWFNRLFPYEPNKCRSSSTEPGGSATISCWPPLVKRPWGHFTTFDIW